MSATLFPLFADLRGRPVLVVGGGAVARRKALALLESGAVVTVGAPVLEPDLAGLAQAGRLRHRPGPFAADWLDETWFVVAATDEPEVNRAVAQAAEQRRVFANIVDDAGASTAQLPAVMRRGPLQLAISSGGGAPMLARHLRERLEAQFDDSLGLLATLLSRQRRRIRARLPDLDARRRFFERVLHGPVVAHIRRGNRAAAERELLAALAEAPAVTVQGRVALVGAGPGDPGLLTLRALRLLNEADVILHDRLVGDGILALARRDAERIEVGKAAGRHLVTQDEIHALMLEHARAGRRVVRLKGGDPFVFGRGGEELEALRAAGIPYEVVPGITAAIACGAYAGIPLTHRDHAQSLRLVTAHAKDAPTPVDWAGLAAPRQTLAVYMGVAALETFRDGLVAHGRDACTPCALVENGSRPEQRVVLGTLADIPEIARAHRVQSPALLVVGDVAALAGTLHWFGAPPLQGLAAALPRAA